MGGSPNRCKCGVPVNVSHFCAVLNHAWIGKRDKSKGCIDHADDPYPGGCPDCADIARNPHAVTLGRKGGEATSERKAASSRENGKKGGRPKVKR